MEIWTCPNCHREFFRPNQQHYCSHHTIEDLLAERPPELTLAFDALLLAVADWQPQTIGAGKAAIVFNNGKAWMVVRPMKAELDVAFFYGEKLKSPLFKTVRLDNMGKNKFIHHLRLRDETYVTDEVIKLLRKGFDYMLEPTPKKPKKRASAKKEKTKA